MIYGPNQRYIDSARSGVFSYILQSFLQYAKKRERIVFRLILYIGMDCKPDGDTISIGNSWHSALIAVTMPRSRIIDGCTRCEMSRTSSQMTFSF